jgi:hypothetical protein
MPDPLPRRRRGKSGETEKKLAGKRDVKKKVTPPKPKPDPKPDDK